MGEYQNSNSFQDVLVFMNYRRLKNTGRCNNFLKILTEDVAQHGYFTALLAMVIADELNDSGFKINVEEVLRKALVHDVPESITGDIPSNVKEHMRKNGISMDELLDEVANEYYMNKELSKYFADYAKLSHSCKDGVEGGVVDLADILELLVYTYEEVSMGNSNMRGLMEKCIRITKSREAYEFSNFAQTLVSSIETDRLSNFQFL